MPLFIPYHLLALVPGSEARGPRGNEEGYFGIP